MTAYPNNLNSKLLLSTVCEKENIKDDFWSKTEGMLSSRCLCTLHKDSYGKIVILSRLQETHR